MLSIVLVLSACRTTHTAVESASLHNTARLQRDSVYLHDSVSLSYRPARSTLSLGEGRGEVDTLYIERWHTHWREKEVIHTDTIQVETTCTETVPVRYVPSFYKYCTAFAFLVLLVLLLRLAWWLYKHFH